MLSAGFPDLPRSNDGNGGFSCGAALDHPRLSKPKLSICKVMRLSKFSEAFLVVGNGFASMLQAETRRTNRQGEWDHATK
jgi:hypothetical protein